MVSGLLCGVTHSYLFPRLDRLQTHPRPLNRVKNLRDNINIQDSIIPHSEFENIENIVNAVEQYLKEELLPYHTEMFEMYGSVYLHSYKKEYLQDRIDY